MCVSLNIRNTLILLSCEFQCEWTKRKLQYRSYLMDFWNTVGGSNKANALAGQLAYPQSPHTSLLIIEAYSCL